MEEGGRSLFVPLPIHIIQQLKAAVTHKTMIRLNSLDCKMKNIMSSILSLFKRSLRKHPLCRVMCPFCGAVGQCRPHGSYHRNLLHFLDGGTEVLRLRIPRVLCSCGHSHALLPDFIVPYLSYSLPMILRILADYFPRRLTVASICGKYGICVTVLYRLKRQFLLHKREWLGILRDMEMDGAAFLGLLYGSENYSADGFGFLRQTTYSFLQSHKNPANCARPHFPDPKIQGSQHNL